MRTCILLAALLLTLRCFSQRDTVIFLWNVTEPDSIFYTIYHLNEDPVVSLKPGNYVLQLIAEPRRSFLKNLRVKKRYFTRLRTEFE